MRMPIIRKCYYTLSVCMLTMALSACENTRIFDSAAIKALRNIDPASVTSPYYLALSRHYLHYAESLRHQANPQAAGKMARRGLEAARSFPPELSAASSATSPEHQQARAFVSYVTSNPGLQARVPNELAQLRWLYDCWEHESSVIHVRPMAAQCRSGYYALADRVFSEFAPGYVAHNHDESSSSPHDVALHPLLEKTPESAHPMIEPASIVQADTAEADDTHTQAPEIALIPDAPLTPDPEELLHAALKENPFLSIAERDAILGTSVAPDVTPTYVPKPARRRAAQRQARSKQSSALIQKPVAQKADATLIGTRRHSIRFAKGDTTLNADAKTYVSRLGAALAAGEPGTVRVTVNGHSDDKDGAEANMRLSLQRALAVKNALVAAGAAVSDIDAFAYGDKQAPEHADDDKMSFRTAEIILKR